MPVLTLREHAERLAALCRAADSMDDMRRGALAPEVSGETIVSAMSLCNCSSWVADMIMARIGAELETAKTALMDALKETG